MFIGKMNVDKNINRANTRNSEGSRGCELYEERDEIPPLAGFTHFFGHGVHGLAYYRRLSLGKVC